MCSNLLIHYRDVVEKFVVGKALIAQVVAKYVVMCIIMYVQVLCVSYLH